MPENATTTNRLDQYRKAAAVQRIKRGIVPVKGTSITCARCGAEFVRLGINAKYCIPCKPLAATECARRQSEKRKTDPDKRARYNKWAREYAARNPAHRVSSHMRKMMHMALRSGKVWRSWREFVDYSLEELMTHLDRQFTGGMSWENYGEWHIDHIVPRSSFDYTSADDDSFRRCWALSNLRPLWAVENIRKNATRRHLI